MMRGLAKIIRTATLSSVFSVTLLTSACGIGDIDRTQPEKISKSIFKKDDGTAAEYYFRQTVIDVPATNGLTFIGEQSDTERVVFDITEDYLFVYRSYPYLADDTEDGVIKGNQGDGYARNGVKVYGSPVAAYSIKSHFDVQRGYNSQTGEQNNVIEENSSDRPWYEREFMRVDWTTNHVKDFRFGGHNIKDSGAVVTVPQEDANGENKDRPVLTSEYIDVVNAFSVEPETLYFEGYGRLPACYSYVNQHKDCLGGTVKVRNSFRRIEESGYVPLRYDNNRFAQFGFFRTERLTNNDKYDVTESGQILLANRWNLWKNAASCYNKDADFPYASCSPDDLKTIVYYLNEDFPALEYKDTDGSKKSLKDMAVANGDQWDDVFKKAILASTGWNADQLNNKRLYIVCPNNPVQEGDPAVCGEAGLNPQIGDLRYSMYYYVPNVQESSPLGYGPSAADPLTGEIVAANAFYYGSAGATIAARTLDIIKIQTGQLTEEDVSTGQNVRDALNYVRSLNQENTQRYAGYASPEFKQAGLSEAVELRIRNLKESIRTGEAYVDLKAVNNAKLERSSLDEMLINDELREALTAPMLMNQERQFNSDAERDAVLAQTIVSGDFLKFNRLQEDRRLMATGNTCMLSVEDVIDDGLLGLQQTVLNKFYNTDGETPVLKNGYTESDVYNFIVINTMGDTQLHEIGHTVGLRHNFSGSTDALNYDPTYWELREKTVQNGRPLKAWEVAASNNIVIQEGHQEALQQGMRDYQNSTVMDYAHTYGTNVNLGLYDYAAIKYAYGDMLEVFNSADITPERASLLRQGELHYTFYPEVVSNAATYGERYASIYDRSNLNYRKLGDSGKIKVPYSFGSDEYRDASAYTAIWDAGADNFERTVYQADNYRYYSIFDSFKRDRYNWGLSIFGYLERIYSRRFSYVLNQYKNWVNESLIIKSGAPCRIVENGEIVESSDTFYSDDNCGGSGLIGTIETLNLMFEVLQKPDLGCYVRLEPGCYEVASSSAGATVATLLELPSSALNKVSSNPDDCATNTPPANFINRAIRTSEPYVHVYNTTSCNGYSVPDAQASNAEQPIEVNYANGGRAANTLYDKNEYGYYFYLKPISMGSWWDKWLAIKAMNDYYTDFIGVDANADTRSFLISLSLIFGEPINNVIGSMVADKTESYAPFFRDGKVNYGGIVSSNGGVVDRSIINTPRLNPDEQYTLRLIALYNAAYQQQAIDQYGFANSIRVFRTNNINTDVDVNIRNSPNFVSMTDPETGWIWYAIKSPTGFSAGYEMLTQFNQAGASNSDFRFLEILYSTYNTFGTNLPWSGDFDL